MKALGDDEEEEVESIFLLILEGMLYTVGSIFFAIAAFFMYRCYKGESLSLSAETELSAKEFEMRPTQKMSITPDEVRTEHEHVVQLQWQPYRPPISQDCSPLCRQEHQTHPVESYRPHIVLVA